VNAPYQRILELLGQASVGLNTMVDEHFGINVVEFMVRSPPITLAAFANNKNDRWVHSGRWSDPCRTRVRRAAT
jgi:hypothetical protein